jgi:hypothetical protein
LSRKSSRDDWNSTTGIMASFSTAFPAMTIRRSSSSKATTSTR